MNERSYLSANENRSEMAGSFLVYSQSYFRKTALVKYCLFTVEKFFTSGWMNSKLTETMLSTLWGVYSWVMSSRL